MTRSACRSRIRKRNGGVLAVCTLVCLMVTATVMAITIQSALRYRRQTRLEQQMVQTDFLLDAGIQRALQKLETQADYEGESWTPAGELTRFGEATVQIAVKREPNTMINAKVTATIIESSARQQKTSRSYEFTVQQNASDISTAE
ncbi:MAG: hypothetical protein AAGG48_00210 [Planctomycetota bacterium]